MSRTIRRKGKDVDPKKKKSYTHTDKWDFQWVNKKLSICKLSRRPLKIYRLPGKEYKKGWWKYHGDHYYPIHTKLYRDSWGDVRTKNRSNLVRHLREDTECFFWEEVNTKDWD